jgi:hypothetical protein
MNIVPSIKTYSKIDETGDRKKGNKDGIRNTDGFKPFYSSG